jgi:hypothetical protein
MFTLNVGNCILHRKINFIMIYNPANKFRKNFYNIHKCAGVLLLFVLLR